MLFVPGNRPGRFAKAAAAGPGLVLLDLEDAVPARERAEARIAVRAALQDRVALGVRINGVGTPDHQADLTALREVPAVVMLAKATSTAELEQVHSMLAPGSVLVALVESAAGVLAAPGLATHPGVARLAFGSLDFAHEIGVSPDDSEALLAARGALVLASAAARIVAPVDGVTVRVDAPEVLAADVALARRLGFGGKLCIHPAQVNGSEHGFAPDPDELDWAERILAAVEATGGDGVLLLDGAMVDKPVLDRARRILEGGRG